VGIQAHGALIDVLEVGVLLLGPSGVGKSECALELVSRGHRLVADDVVRIRRLEGSCDEAAGLTGPGPVLVGTSPELIRHYMEIRGIGLLYIPDLYGAEAVRTEAPIDLLCRLEPWREGGEYERVGLERPRENLAGVSLPVLVLPVRPARNMATLVEVGVRDHLQRAAGSNAAQRLDERLRAEHARQ
jgi:HPr kinase/phosphorylase